MAKEKKRFSLWEKLILLIAVAVFLVSAGQIAKWLYTGYESAQVTENLAKEAVVVQKTEDSSSGLQPSQNDAAEGTDTGQKNAQEIPVTADFAALQKSNPDIVAWIYSPGTKINYPVVQGTDNDYYLHRLVNGQKNAGGTLFMDCNNEKTFTDDNTIIYGHHMKNGSMFAGLEKYKEQSYYDAHPVLYLLTPEKSYRLVVFAGFVTASDSPVYTLQFPDEDRQSWIEKALKQSDFQTDVRVAADEPVVTLSTCDYTYEDARYVVLGILR